MTTRSTPLVAVVIWVGRSQLRNVANLRYAPNLQCGVRCVTSALFLTPNVSSPIISDPTSVRVASAHCPMIRAGVRPGNRVRATGRSWSSCFIGSRYRARKFRILPRSNVTFGSLAGHGLLVLISDRFQVNQRLSSVNALRNFTRKGLFTHT